MIHWVTPYFEPKDRERHGRILECIEKNLQLSGVERVTLLSEENSVPIDSPKVQIEYIDKRATFADYLMLVDQASDTQSIFVLTNSDILFTEDAYRLAQRVTLPTTAIAITRRELDESYPNGGNPQLSQDVWALKAQLIPDTLIQTTNFFLGVAGCENLFATQLVTHGFNVWNPCLDARFYHNDPSPSYHYDKRYYGLYFYPMACNISAVERDKPQYQVKLRAPKYELQVQFGSS